MKFRLLTAHYVRVRNREHYFEQKETALGTNEAVTHRARCDTYLDPNDPSQWNWDPINEKYRRPGSFRPAMNEVGWLVITTKLEGNPHELHVVGPTVEMEGLDKESQAIIEKLRNDQVYQKPFDELPVQGGLVAK